MEASGSVAAGQAAGGDAAAAAGEGEGEGAQAPDYGALQGDLAAVQAQQQEMFDWMRSQGGLPAAGEGAPSAEEAQAAISEMDLSFLDDTDPAYDPETTAAQLAAAIDRAADAKAAERMAPVEKRTQAIETALAVKDMESRYPELAKPEVAGPVLDIAAKRAQMMGQPQLAGSLDFIELVYLSGRSLDRANKEGDEPGVAHLEGGGGASPAGGSKVDLGDAIVNAGGKGSSVLPFG